MNTHPKQTHEDFCVDCGEWAPLVDDNHEACKACQEHREHLAQEYAVWRAGEPD
jgi:hypothetical protein